MILGSGSPRTTRVTPHSVRRTNAATTPALGDITNTGAPASKPRGGVPLPPQRAGVAAKPVSTTQHSSPSSVGRQRPKGVGFASGQGAGREEIAQRFGTGDGALPSAPAFSDGFESVRQPQVQMCIPVLDASPGLSPAMAQRASTSLLPPHSHASPTAAPASMMSGPPPSVLRTLSPTQSDEAHGGHPAMDVRRSLVTPDAQVASSGAPAASPAREVDSNASPARVRTTAARGGLRGRLEATRNAATAAAQRSPRCPSSGSPSPARATEVADAERRAHPHRSIAAIKESFGVTPSEERPLDFGTSAKPLQAATSFEDVGLLTFGQHTVMMAELPAATHTHAGEHNHPPHSHRSRASVEPIKCVDGDLDEYLHHRVRDDEALQDFLTDARRRESSGSRATPLTQRRFSGGSDGRVPEHSMGHDGYHRGTDVTGLMAGRSLPAPVATPGLSPGTCSVGRRRSSLDRPPRHGAPSPAGLAPSSHRALFPRTPSPGATPVQEPRSAAAAHRMGDVGWSEPRPQHDHGPQDSPAHLQPRSLLSESGFSAGGSSARHGGHEISRDSGNVFGSPYRPSCSAPEPESATKPSPQHRPRNYELQMSPAPRQPQIRTDAPPPSSSISVPRGQATAARGVSSHTTPGTAPRTVSAAREDSVGPDGKPRMSVLKRRQLLAMQGAEGSPAPVASAGAATTTFEGRTAVVGDSTALRHAPRPPPPRAH